MRLRPERYVPEADELIHIVGLEFCEDRLEGRQVSVDVRDYGEKHREPGAYASA